jgi:rhodanese-related sulfurtransferase
MPDDLRISADELQRRMASGEGFTVIDVPNPHAWAEAADMASGAIRVALDGVNQELEPKDKPIVTDCT